jgi:hypothetical protein
VTCATAAAIAAAIFLGSQQSATSPGAWTGRDSAFDVPSVFANLLGVPSLWAGTFGVNWGLGWLDTPMPGAVWVPVGFVVSGLVFLSLVVVGWRKTLLLLGLLAMLTVLPTFILAAQGAVVGESVQARYLTPLVFLTVGVALAPLPGSSPRSLSRAQRWLGTLGMAAGASVALHVQIRRYVTGLDVAGFDLRQDAEWWSLPTVGPLHTWVVGSCAGLVVFYFAFRLNRVVSPPHVEQVALP